MSEKKQKGIHVLLVGHDPDSIRVEKNCLEEQGGLYVETAGYNETVSILEKNKPDVIIVDCLCTQNGFELVGTLQSKCDMMPIIVFSHDDEKETLAELCKSRTLGFVEKSGNPERVYSSLKSCIVAITTHH